MSILGEGPVTLYRYPVGSRGTDRKWDRGAATTSTIQATVQPASGRDMMILPEGIRQKRGIKIYTETEVKTADHTSGAKRDADRILYQGEMFEIQKLLPQPEIEAHYKAIAVLLDEATS